MTDVKKQILLFGSSCNPPTGLKGHMGAISYCKLLDLYDEIWILPVYQHIYSNKRNLAPFIQRKEMCQLAIKQIPIVTRETIKNTNVYIKEYEKELYEDSIKYLSKDEILHLRLGSIDLILYLRQKYPNVEFTMLLGKDTYQDLCAGKWKKGDELRTLVKFIVLERQGYISMMENHDTDRNTVQFMTIHELGEVSSTAARMTTDKEVLNTLVGEEVADYIQQHELYAFKPDDEKYII